MTEFGYCPIQRRASSGRSGPPCRQRGRGRLRLRAHSDHFHPWIDRQGHSPFVWGVLGAIAEATERLRSGPGSRAPRCGSIRRSSPRRRRPLPPDAGALLPRRGDRREPQRAHPGRALAAVGRPRRDARGGRRGHPRALEGEVTSHHGRYYEVENARIYTLPERAASDPCGGRRPEAWPARRPHRRRPHRDGARTRSSRGVQDAGGDGAALRRR